MSLPFVSVAPPTLASLAPIVPMEPAVTSKQAASQTLKFVEDVKANGSLVWCSNGNRVAIGIRGNAAFVERFANFCYNRGVIGTGSPVQWCYLEGKSIAYVLTLTLDRLKEGVASQLRSEIIMSGEVPPLKDYMDEEKGEYVLELDEARIAVLAAERAAQFMAECLHNEPFLYRPDDIAPEEFAVYSPAENRDGEDFS
jgi:hypothetical protein